MAKDTNASQSQKTASSTPIPGIAFDEGMARFGALLEQMRGFEQQALDRANQLAEQSAEITKGAIAYMARLSDSWRQMAIDSMRQGAQVFNQGS